MSQSTTSLPHVEYETTTFTLQDDNLGHNKATLLHARTTNNDSQFYKAILYTHGYSDYFFQYVIIMVNHIDEYLILFPFLVTTCLQNSWNMVTIFLH